MGQRALNRFSAHHAIMTALPFALISASCAVAEDSTTSGTGPSSTSPTRPSVGRHVMFNGGYGGPLQTVGGPSTGPRFTKGHTWITKKAIDFLKERNLLPVQMSTAQAQNYVYYGTAFADWQWLGQPENPDGPVPSPVTANLDAYGTLLATTSNCPYAANCPVANDLQGTLPAGTTYNRSKVPTAPVAAGKCLDQYTHASLTTGDSQCADNKWHFSDDYDANGTQADLTPSNSNCLAASPIAAFEDPNIERTTKVTVSFSGDLYMRVSGIYGLGNGLRTYNTGDFTWGKTYVDEPADIFTTCTSGSSYQGHPWTFMEDRIEIHQNPVMQFVGSVLIGGGDVWLDWLSSSAALQWGGSPQFFALDNLYHYSLGDITLYSGLNKTPANPKKTDSAIAACAKYLSGKIYYNTDAYYVCQGSCDATIFGYFTGCGCDYLKDSVPGWEDTNKWSQFEACLITTDPLSTNVILYPMLFNDYVALAPTAKDHPMILKDALLQLQYQPVIGNVSYGAPRYGSILYQLSRKFFQGSPAEPSLNELIRAGNDVPADDKHNSWKTGGMYGAAAVFGTADFSSASVAFPHTYLGGNPFICAGGSQITDTCADGTPTWPTWVPEQYDGGDPQAFINKLSVVNPGRSDRAALIYLGWTAHLMQDLSLPHHASNWSSGQHANQDAIGDFFAVADVETNSPNLFPVGDDAANAIAAELAKNLDLGIITVTLPDIKTLLDAFYQQIETDLDNKLAPYGGSNPLTFRLDDYCNSVHLPRGSVVAGSIDWASVLPAFVAQGARAAAARQPVWNNTSRMDLLSSYSTGIMRNAIEQTIDLLLCAVPSACTTNCGVGTACTSNESCASGYCANGVCQTPPCTSNCTQGTPCSTNANCASGYCANGVCQTPTCTSNCAQGTPCSTNANCASGFCSGGVCQSPACSPLCSDGAVCGNNGDCASRVCQNNVCQPPGCAPRCNRGAGCGSNADCGSQVCTNGLCQAPACSSLCSQGAVCGDNGDCASRVCENNVCQPPGCSPLCNQGAPCGANGDCGSRVCVSGICQAPSCAPACNRGASCNNNGDCASHTCSSGTCQ